MMSGEYMAQKMDDQITGAISENERLGQELEYVEELLRWANSKLHYQTFLSMDDALMQDRMKLWLEHRIAG